MDVDGDQFRSRGCLWRHADGRAGLWTALSALHHHLHDGLRCRGDACHILPGGHVGGADRPPRRKVYHQAVRRDRRLRRSHQPPLWPAGLRGGDLPVSVLACLRCLVAAVLVPEHQYRPAHRVLLYRHGHGHRAQRWPAQRLFRHSGRDTAVRAGLCAWNQRVRRRGGGGSACDRMGRRGRSVRRAHRPVGLDTVRDCGAGPPVPQTDRLGALSGLCRLRFRWRPCRRPVHVRGCVSRSAHHVAQQLFRIRDPAGGDGAQARSQPEYRR